MKPPIFETLIAGLLIVQIAILDIPPEDCKLLASVGVVLSLLAVWLLWYSHRVVDKARKKLKEEMK